MAAEVTVEAKDADTFLVIVAAASTTTHQVTVTDADLAAYAPGASKEGLLEASFEFLLQREPNTMILSSFKLPVIESYFPDYSGEMRKRFA